jgi:hypothetical protein
MKTIKHDKWWMFVREPRDKKMREQGVQFPRSVTAEEAENLVVPKLAEEAIACFPLSHMEDRYCVGGRLLPKGA